MGEHGSYALGKNHQDLFLIRIESLQRQIEAVLNKLIRRIVDWNFLSVEKYPTFHFNEVVETDMKELAERFQILVQTGIISPEEYTS